MKHNIRQRVLDPVRGLVTKVVTVDGELDSGIRDRHGVEIFEGDLIKNPSYNPDDVMDTPEYVVVYDPEETALVYRDPVLHKANTAVPYPNDPLSCFPYELEVIGHVDD